MHSRSFLWWLIYTIPILAEAFIFMIFSPQIPGKNIPSQLALCLFFVEVSWLMFLFLHCCRFPLDKRCIFFVDDKKSRVEIHEAKNSTFFHPTTIYQPSLQMTSGSASETERVVDSFGLASPVWSWPVDEVSDHKTLGKFAVFLKGLHPWKLTWNPKIGSL